MDWKIGVFQLINYFAVDRSQWYVFLLLDMLILDFEVRQVWNFANDTVRAVIFKILRSSVVLQFIWQTQGAKTNQKQLSVGSFYTLITVSLVIYTP